MVPIKSLKSILNISPDSEELKHFCFNWAIDIIEVFTDEGITRKTDNTEYLYKWSEIHSIKKTEKYIYVFYAKYKAHIIPLRYFKSDMDVNEFFMVMMKSKYIEYELIIGKGIGPFVLGMTCEEIREQIKEEEVYEDWMYDTPDTEVTITLHGLILIFDLGKRRRPVKESKLIGLDIEERTNARLCGKNLFEWTYDDFCRYLDQNSILYTHHDTDEIEIRKPTSSNYFSFHSNYLEGVIIDYIPEYNIKL